MVVHEMSATPLYLHGFGARYGLPVPLALYVYAGGAVVLVSFILVVAFAGHRVGERATRYPRREAPLLVTLGNSLAVRLVLGLVGVLTLLTVIVTGFLGSQTATKNPGSYLVWVYFWAASVILTGLVGNVWTYLNPFRTIYRLLSRVLPHRGDGGLPEAVGVWPAAALYFCFAWVELASGQASHPAAVAVLATAYAVLTVAAMFVFGERTWLGQGELFTVLFDVVARFGPVETERDDSGGLRRAWVRPIGAGLLAPVRGGWDRVVFVILMLSSLAFDGVTATDFWARLTDSAGPFAGSYGSWSDLVQHSIGLVCISAIFLVVFWLFMQGVLRLGGLRGDGMGAFTSFAFTLVPIALVYNAAHNYTYVTVTSQGLFPLLADPLQRGWHLFAVDPQFTPSLIVAQAATVWYAQLVLIVLGHIVAVYLAHLRAGQVFRKARAVLVSQYPMLILMVGYTMTSLWILAQPITSGG